MQRSLNNEKNIPVPKKVYQQGLQLDSRFYIATIFDGCHLDSGGLELSLIDISNDEVCPVLFTQFGTRDTPSPLTRTNYLLYSMGTRPSFYLQESVHYIARS